MTIPVHRQSVAPTETDPGESFRRLLREEMPALDGELLLDEASRRAYATDLGNIREYTPHAVLRPRSARDVAAAIRSCRAHGVDVAVRGLASTTLGQTLSTGLVIDSRSLDRIHAIGPDTAEVDAGVLWSELVEATVAGTPPRTPPALTAYTSLTVGGTLSVGGLGGLVGALRTGLQVDHVRELEVVTGTGEVERCSPRRSPELFDAVLGGLGQCGVITRAVLELVPAVGAARTYVLGYTDNAAFFRDMRTLIERPGIDHVYGTLQAADAAAPGPTHQLHATVLHEPGVAPDDAALLEGVGAVPTVVDGTYTEHVHTIDRMVDGMRDAVDWGRLAKPWYDVWLPGGSVESYVAEVHAGLSPRDLGPYGISLIYPQRREHLTRPLPALPEPDGSPWVYVLDVNTTADTVDGEPGFVTEMLDRNDRWFARARERHGAVLYPIGSLRFTAQDWRVHFGAAWPALRAAKERFDPDHVLTPGPGIFAG